MALFECELLAHLVRYSPSRCAVYCTVLWNAFSCAVQWGWSYKEQGCIVYSRAVQCGWSYLEHQCALVIVECVVCTSVLQGRKLWVEVVYCISGVPFLSVLRTAFGRLLAFCLAECLVTVDRRLLCI